MKTIAGIAGHLGQGGLIARPALWVLVLAMLAAPALTEAKSSHCPPGLAKKSPACIPPGQAKKRQRHWETGDRLPEDDLHWITRPGLYDLPPLPAGQRYVVLGNRIYRVDEGTSQILSVLNVIDALLD
jgi:hypothetical protein